MKCGVDFGMTEKPLDLLDGHALVYRHGGECTTKLVGMGFCNVESLSQETDHPFDGVEE